MEIPEMAVAVRCGEWSDAKARERDRGRTRAKRERDRACGWHLYVKTGPTVAMRGCGMSKLPLSYYSII